MLRRWGALCLGTAWVLAGGPAAPAAAPPPGVAEQARGLLDAGDAPGNVDRATGLLEAAAREPGVSAEVLTVLAEAHYKRGSRLEERKNAVAAFEAAVAAADRALALRPDEVRARYWRGVALLSQAGRIRGAESFGLVRRAVRDLETVAAADPDLDDAGADRALGKVYLESPWWFLGDTEKAVQRLEAARGRAPQSFQNRRFLAEAYAASGREADALKELQDLLAMPVRPAHERSDTREHEVARRLAERLRARLRRQ